MLTQASADDARPRLRLLATVQAFDAGLGRAYQALMYRDLWLYACAAFFVYLAAGTTPFSAVLREDAYNFVVKGMEASTGDFSLERAQAIGWPLLLGLVFTVLDVDNIFEAMFVARWSSIFCLALAVILLGAVCKRALEGSADSGLVPAVVVTFMLAPLSRFAARSAMTEALFMVSLLLIVLFFMSATARGATRPGYALLASLSAAASYYVRPNGLFLFAALVIALMLVDLRGTRLALRTVSLAAATFLLATLPYLHARHVSFGSPFDYGPNSKHFVEDYEHVWADNISAPSLWTYLTTNDWEAHYERFIDNGLLEVIRLTTGHLLNVPWMVLSAIGVLAILAYWKRAAVILPVTLFVSIAGMSVVFDVFGSTRHLIYFIPLLLLTAAFGFLFFRRQGLRIANVAATALIVLAMASVQITWLDSGRRVVPEVKDHWAVWAANNLHGNVAIIEGGDILEMSEHYAETGWRVIKDFKDVVPRIKAVRPGIHQTLADAFEEFRQNDIRYLITDAAHIKRRPYLRDVTEAAWRRHFRPIGHFYLGDKGAQLYDVNIYEVVY